MPEGLGGEERGRSKAEEMETLKVSVLLTICSLRASTEPVVRGSCIKSNSGPLARHAAKPIC